MTPVKTILPAVLLALLLTGCTAAPAAKSPSPAEETEPSPSAAESQASEPEASSEEGLAEDEPLDPEVEQQSGDMLLPLMETGDAAFLSQTEQCWQENIDWMYDQGLISKKPDVSEVMVRIEF